MIQEVILGIAVAGFFTFILIIAVFFFTKWLNGQSKPKEATQNPADYPIVDAVNFHWDAAHDVITFSLHIDASWKQVFRFNIAKMTDLRYTIGGPAQRTATYPISLIKNWRRPTGID